MVDSAAERARRARRHKKGDHSQCDPERRCEAVAAAAARDAAAQTIVNDDCEYGPRGSLLRDALSGEPLGPAHRVLVDEAARIADRLDKLDYALQNKGTWLRFETADGGEIVVTVDNVLAEARQQATTLRGLVAELRAALPAPKKNKPAEKPGGIGDLSARIAARRNTAAG